MTKSKNTKRALLMSILSMLLCVSMLASTTFAWFTDSVTSGKNKIVAGNLDVQLLMKTAAEGDYEDISDLTAPIFGSGSVAQNNNAETLWEPGKTQVAYLAIKNNGNLGLTYKVDLDVQNVAKDLYKVMQYDITPDAKYGEVTSWAGNGKSVVPGAQMVSDSANVFLGAEDTHYFALSIHMDEEAGNDYMGGEVNFDLTVHATQATYESDSFDNQYDRVADLIQAGYVEVKTGADFMEAAKKGEKIVLADDVKLTNTLSLIDASFTLDGNGHTITQAENGTTNKVAQIDITRGSATIKNVTFDGIQDVSVIRTVYADLDMDNVTVENCRQTTIQGLVRLLGKSTVTNCTFKNNDCKMVVTINFDYDRDDVNDPTHTAPQVVKDCVFEGNTCKDTAVLYYVHGASATIDGNKFLNNTVTTDGPAATVYMGFTENNVITKNVFSGNRVTITSETIVRATGGLMIGYEATIRGNSFVDNTITAEGRQLGNDVCVSVFYTDIDLSGNYWGGGAPVEGDDYFVEHSGHRVIINDSLTTYGD